MIFTRLVFFVVGLLYLIGAVFNLNWILYNKKTEFIDEFLKKYIGKNGIRIMYGITGILLMFEGVCLPNLMSVLSK